jgi:hypothetical protein
MSDAPRNDGPKAPPEALALRGRPRRVIRFRRRLVIALAALFSAAVFGAAWLALESMPARSRQEAPAETARKAMPDGLLALPASHDQIPKPVPALGPPLPGDLGLSVVERERSLGLKPAPSLRPNQEEDASRRRACVNDHEILTGAHAVWVNDAIGTASAASAGSAPTPTIPPTRPWPSQCLACTMGRQGRGVAAVPDAGAAASSGCGAGCRETGISGGASGTKIMTADAPALLQLGITHPDARIDREDARSAKGRLQQAVREGHLTPRSGLKHQFVVTECGRAVLTAQTREADLITPYDREPTPDERAGTAWWNALDEAARRHWL